MEAETIAQESGIETEGSALGGIDVYDINAGDSIEVKNVDFSTAGAGTFTARVASAAPVKAPRTMPSSCISTAPPARSSARFRFPTPAAGQLENRDHYGARCHGRA